MLCTAAAAAAEIRRAAVARDVEPEALLAVVDVQGGGHAYAAVGGRLMPLIRFEHHVFHRRLSPAARPKAVSEGLAAPRPGMLANPRRQHERYALLTRAERIDREAAHAACAWGVGRVLGEQARWLGYESAEALADRARAGLDGQIALMMRFIENRGLGAALAARDWTRFAEGYNGPLQGRLDYAGRMARAYHAWRATPVPSVPPAPLLALGARGPDVERLQRRLSAVGHPVAIDGFLGPATSAAIHRFQAERGLVRDGIAGSVTWARLGAPVNSRDAA